MSRLSNQHSWHQTSEQKPNMTPSSLDATQDVEKSNDASLQNHLHHTFTVSKIRVHVGS